MNPPKELYLTWEEEGPDEGFWVIHETPENAREYEGQNPTDVNAYTFKETLAVTKRTTYRKTKKKGKK